MVIIVSLFCEYLTKLSHVAAIHSILLWRHDEKDELWFSLQAWWQLSSRFYCVVSSLLTLLIHWKPTANAGVKKTSYLYYYYYKKIIIIILIIIIIIILVPTVHKNIGWNHQIYNGSHVKKVSSFSNRTNSSGGENSKKYRLRRLTRVTTKRVTLPH